MKNFYRMIYTIFLILTAGMITEGNAKWTFMVYLDGDNNLESAAIADFLEMAEVGSDGDMNIVVLFDRISGEDSSYGNWTDTRIFHITKDLKPYDYNAEESWGEKNMGDPDTLINFVQWCKNHYPADYYALILWNHGGPGWRFPFKKRFIARGSYKAVAYDDTSGSDEHLSNEELRYALSQIKTILGKNISLIGFDACLDGMLEMAYSIKDGCDYIVFSEEYEPGDGWPYDEILPYIKNNPSLSPEEFARKIVQEYRNEYYFSDPATTSSAVASSKIDALAQSVSELASAMNKEWAQIQSARAIVQEFAYADQVDLLHLVNLISQNCEDSNIKIKAEAVASKFTQAIITNYMGLYKSGAYGMAIYFDKSSMDSDYDDTHVKFAQDYLWDEFLNNYYSSDKTPPSAPLVYDPGDTNNSSSFILKWNKPVDDIAVKYKWKVIDNYELIVNDNAESGMGNWDTYGFSVSATYHHSGTHSFYSGSGDNLNNYMRLKNKFSVNTNTEISFWVYYNIEEGYDFAYLEVSEDGSSWDTLISFTGKNTVWTKIVYSLKEYAGKEIYLRFRYETDDYYAGALVGWFYVDDIKIEKEGNKIKSGFTTETNVTIDGIYQSGLYFCRVKAADNNYNWSSWSEPVDIYIESLAPQIRDIQITPSTGNSYTNFIFSFDYYHKENLPPDSGFPVIYIYNPDNKLVKTGIMEPVDLADNNYSDGKQYKFNLPALTLIEPGEYKFKISVKASSGTIPDLITSSPVAGPVIQTYNPPSVEIKSLTLRNNQLNLLWSMYTGKGFDHYLICYDSKFHSTEDEFPYKIQIPEITKTSYTISGLPSGNTYYVGIVVYDKLGNKSELSVSQVHSLVKSSEQEEDNLVVYPNPVMNDSKISFPQLIDKVDSSETVIYIYDIAGKLVGEYINTSEVEVNNLKSGIYLAVIKVNGNIYKKGKIIIIR